MTSDHNSPRETDSYTLFIWETSLLFLVLLLSGCVPQETSQIASPTTPASTSPSSNRQTSSSTITLSPTSEQLPSPTTTVNQEHNIPDTTNNLFSGTTETIDIPVDSPTIIRSRFVVINFDIFTDENDSKVTNYVTLNLFPETTYIAVLDHVENNPSGGFTWIGHLNGVDNSHTTLVINGDVMIGKITTPTEIYEIRYLDDHIHMIVQIDQSAFPDELEPISVP